MFSQNPGPPPKLHAIGPLHAEILWERVREGLGLSDTANKVDLSINTARIRATRIAGLIEDTRDAAQRVHGVWPATGERRDTIVHDMIRLSTESQVAATHLATFAAVQSDDQFWMGIARLASGPIVPFTSEEWDRPNADVRRERQVGTMAAHLRARQVATEIQKHGHTPDRAEPSDAVADLVQTFEAYVSQVSDRAATLRRGVEAARNLDDPAWVESTERAAAASAAAVAGLESEWTRVAGTRLVYGRTTQEAPYVEQELHKAGDMYLGVFGDPIAAFADSVILARSEGSLATETGLA